MKKRLFPVALMACTVILSACSKNDGNDTSKSQADKLEDCSMTTEWINYTVAASSELLDDCIALWASWNGPTGIPDEDWERIGRDFFTKNTMVGSNGYADYMRTAEAGNRAFTSGVVIRRLRQRDGLEIDNVGQALDRAAEDLSQRLSPSIYITLTDGAGNRRAYPESILRVRVTGAGTLAGFGSAAYQSEHGFTEGVYETFGGRALAVIRSTHEAGPVTLIVEGEQVKETIEFEVIS